jgi:hypothetical protein
MNTKRAGSIRLTEEAWRLWRLLAMQSGVTLTAMLEIILRDYAERKGILSTEGRRAPRPETGG